MMAHRRRRRLSWIRSHRYVSVATFSLLRLIADFNSAAGFWLRFIIQRRVQREESNARGKEAVSGEGDRKCHQRRAQKARDPNEAISRIEAEPCSQRCSSGAGSSPKEGPFPQEWCLVEHSSTGCSERGSTSRLPQHVKKSGTTSKS